VSPDPKQIQLSASARGIVDYFFCFTCDESFAHDGRSRTLEIEFRISTPFGYQCCAASLRSFRSCLVGYRPQATRVITGFALTPPCLIIKR
jgi:hypothetical protein